MKSKVFLLSVFGVIFCCSCAAQNQPQMAAGSLPQCVASVNRDVNGHVTDVVPASNCQKGGGPGSNVKLFIVVEPDRKSVV